MAKNMWWIRLGVYSNNLIYYNIYMYFYLICGVYTVLVGGLLVTSSRDLSTEEIDTIEIIKWL